MKQEFIAFKELLKHLVSRIGTSESSAHPLLWNGHSGFHTPIPLLAAVPVQVQEDAKDPSEAVQCHRWVWDVCEEGCLVTLPHLEHFLQWAWLPAMRIISMGIAASYSSGALHRTWHLAYQNRALSVYCFESALQSQKDICKFQGGKKKCKKRYTTLGNVRS